MHHLCTSISSDGVFIAFEAYTATIPAWMYVYIQALNTLSSARFGLLSHLSGVNFWNSRHSLQLSDSSAWGIFETHFTTQTILYLWCNVNTAAHKTDAVITLSFRRFVPRTEITSPRSGMPTDDRTVGKEQQICYQWQRAVMDFRTAGKSTPQRAADSLKGLATWLMHNLHITADINTWTWK